MKFESLVPDDESNYFSLAKNEDKNIINSDIYKQPSQYFKKVEIDP